MIKSDRGMVELKGGVNEILTDFTIAGKAIYENISKERGEKIAHEILDDAFADIFKSEKDVAKEVSDALAELLAAMDENIKLRKELREKMKRRFEED